MRGDSDGSLRACWPAVDHVLQLRRALIGPAGSRQSVGEQIAALRLLRANPQLRAQARMQVAARFSDFAAGPEVQQRRQRTRRLLEAVLLTNGRTLASALPEDVVAVLQECALSGRTSSRDGELTGMAASQALQNVAGDLRHLFAEERSAHPWEPESSRGNPALSVPVADLLDGYSKYLLSKGVVPQAAPAMTRADSEAWMEEAWALMENERSPAARLRAARNACFGTVLAAVGPRSEEMLRCDWDCVLEPAEEGGAGAEKVLVVVTKTELQQAAQRRGAGGARWGARGCEPRRTQLVLERKDLPDEQRCACTV